MKSIFGRIRKWAGLHKIASGVIIVGSLYAGYYAYGKFASGSMETRYVLTAATRGTITTSVSGTGQVSAQNQVDLKPQGTTQSAATITDVNVAQGDKVHTGQLIAVVDNKSALVSLTQAKASLQSAQANLDKLLAGDTAADLAVSQAAVDADQVSLANANQAFIDKLNAAITSVSGVLYEQMDSLFTNPQSTNPVMSFSTTDSQAANNAPAELVAAGAELAAWKNEMRSLSASSPLDAFAAEYQKSQQHLAAVKTFLGSTMDALIAAIPSASLSQDTISTDKSTVSTAQSSVDTLVSGINTSYQSIQDAVQQLDQAKAALDLKKAPPRTEDIETAKAQVTTAQAQLQAAQNTYDQSFIRAPFDGVVAAVDVSAGDVVTPSTVVATVITEEQLAHVSLNEVDAAKVKLGDKAALTFDALPDVSIAGTVAQIDTIGTVTQGVVTYNAQIAFAAQNNQVKPGMSVSAAIITDSKRDALIVPNGAIKTQAGNSYVQVLPGVDSSNPQNLSPRGITSAAAPELKRVKTGISNDSQTEITSGLNDGDLVVLRTTTGVAQTAAAGGARVGGRGGGFFFGGGRGGGG